MDREQALAALERSLESLRAALATTDRRKQLGAFYTGDDVTAYIASRSILPVLLRRVAEAMPDAVHSWTKLLRDAPERYVPADLRHETELPGECRRELVARQQRCRLVMSRLRSPRPVSVAELTTLNLDLDQLVADWLHDGDERLRAAMRRSLVGGGTQAPFSVLDPTCGDGAFLLAALRTLQRIYAACGLGSDSEAVAAIAGNHLYGVDLLPQAVEVCRRRLLLECMLHTSTGARHVRLPEIATNLRVGNSLTGDVETNERNGDAHGVNGEFHWSREFPEVMRRGFDVIIGNPPYVEYTRAGVDFPLRGAWRTRRCDNLHALVTERAASLLCPDGALAFVVPAASVCTPRMQPLVELLQERFGGLWFSLYDERPGKLFPGVDQQLAILLAHGGGPCRELAVTPMRHWSTRPHDERRRLFTTLAYQPLPPDLRTAGVIPKLGSPLELELLAKLANVARLEWRAASQLATAADGAETVYYRNAGGRYWRLVKSFPTRYQSERGTTRTSTEMTLSVRPGLPPVMIACFSSSLFYWYWRVASNCRHLTERELSAFPIPPSLAEPAALEVLRTLCRRYERCLKQTMSRKATNNANSGRIVQDEYRVAAAKPILDEIDRALAPHYGLSAAELDFVINYDLKYRMAGRRSSAKVRPAPATSPR